MFDLEEWQGVAERCDEAISELRSLLSEQRQSLTNHLHLVCESNGLAVRSIKGSTDNSVFEIHFKGNTSNSIQFSKKFLAELNMSFSVQRMLDSNADTELYLEVYPIEK